MADVLPIRLPFREQIDFFRQKLNLPTERWNDVEREAHDRAFVVAGAMQADLLDDLRQAVDGAITGGTTLAEFRAQFLDIIRQRGWAGFTGDDRSSDQPKGGAGIAWRTRVIYNTNVSTSYAAGRWQQLNDPALLAERPLWRYIHNDLAISPRPLHKAWSDSGLTLPHDHPFWRTHFPPNGWGCRCRVKAVRAPGRNDSTEPPAGWDQRDGKGLLPGVQQGWDYAPGASMARLVKQTAKKAADLPLPLADQLSETLTSVRRFEPQKTAKAAAEWAVRNDLADFADYKGIDPEVANEWNRSLFDHLQEFPELRKNQRYVGSAQGQFSRYATVRRAAYAATLVARGMPADMAEKYAASRIKKPRVEGLTFAQSWAQPEAQGIAVNAKHGADAASFKARLVDLEARGWFPPGSKTIRSVVDHELGHQIDDLLGLRLDKEVIALHNEAVRQGMASEVSGYAAHNGNPIAEFIAECWSESINNTSPRAFARALAGIARARYRSKFPA